MGGGGSTKVKTEQQAPQLPEETKGGVVAGEDFFKGILANPPVYQGQRLAPETATQQQAIQQGQQIFGSPGPVQGAASNQLQNTLQGNYLLGPGAQDAVRSLAAPIFQDWRTQVAPGLRDAAQSAGQGVTGTRRGVAEGEAQETFARNIVNSAIAPVYTQERALQLEASKQSPANFATDMLRNQQLAATGAQERQFAQEPLDIAQQKFEEPLFRQSQAADALFGVANFGPGSSGSTSKETQSGMQQLMPFLQIAATLAAAWIISTKSAKTDVTQIPDEEEVVKAMLNAPVTQWRYKHDISGKRHIGPMLEDLPEIIEDSAQTLSVVSYLGALLLTIQKQNERITKLERQISAANK